jgi:hypothetical protein
VGRVRWVGVQAHCWGSETSEPAGADALEGPGGLWLFDFWIVDASIARIAVSPAWFLSCEGCLVVGCGGCGCLFL